MNNRKRVAVRAVGLVVASLFSVAAVSAPAHAVVSTGKTSKVIVQGGKDSLWN